MDFMTINRSADLLKLCGVALKRVAGTQGGEYAGPCPFCGGEDRFHVQPAHPTAPRWMCRKCSEGRWHTAIDFVMLRDGVDLVTAARRLDPPSGLRSLPIAGVACAPAPGAAPAAAVGGQRGGGPPPETWQSAGRDLVEAAVRKLWCSADGERALRWLERRGLWEACLRSFLVGWSPGLQSGGVVLPRGVTLPCMAGETLWYVKVAPIPGQTLRCQGCRKMTTARRKCPACGCENKYRSLPGGRGNAIYNCDDLRSDLPVVFVEGEFDCIIAWQALRERTAVVTLGSASSRPAPATWGRHLLQAQRVYTLYDNDAAGEQGREIVRQLSGGSSRDLRLPEGVKDASDFVTGGGDLLAWWEENTHPQEAPGPQESLGLQEAPADLPVAEG